jgi:hypothetical protein
MDHIKNINSINDVYDFSINIYKKYIISETQEILNYLNEIENCVFKNYDTWTWIEPLIALKSRLSNDLATKIKCKMVIEKVLDTGNESQKSVKKNVFQRILSGEENYDDLIKIAQERNDKENELESRIKTIMQLITVIEMGASEKFTVEMAENKLNEMIEETKILI